MSKQLSVTEAIERAKRVQEERLSSIQVAAQARQDLTEARSDADAKRAALERELSEKLRSAEAADLSAYNAAVSVGWSVGELREIGLAEPAKKQGARKRMAKGINPASKTRRPVKKPNLPNTDETIKVIIEDIEAVGDAQMHSVDWTAQLTALDEHQNVVVERKMDLEAITKDDLPRALSHAITELIGAQFNYDRSKLDSLLDEIEALTLDVWL